MFKGENPIYNNLIRYLNMGKIGRNWELDQFVLRLSVAICAGRGGGFNFLSRHFTRLKIVTRAC